MKISEKELNLISTMKYSELCKYLKAKYGVISEPYFVNADCKTVNQNIKRTSEGLFIHHIGEKESIELSNPRLAIKAPFEYQLGKNLVYCNYFEHMFLHIKIVDEFLRLKKCEETKMAVGIGGLMNFIFPEIIDYINGYPYKRDYMKTALSIIDGNEDFFIKTLFDFQSLIDKPKYSTIMVRLYRPRRPDPFAGKMTSRGKFNELVDSYAYRNKLFQFNEYCEAEEYLEELIKSKPVAISLFRNRAWSRGDNCSFVIYCKKGKKEYSHKGFRLYPQANIAKIEDIISIYNESKKK